MRISHDDDVIAAIATPVGEGGIAVVRLSGPGAISVADKNFRGSRKLESARTRTAHVGLFVDEHGSVLDEVVATIFRTPHSYTGEDIVELSCHGGMYVTGKILESLLHSGARQARPGEFTLRAFLNGRIDLSQAEAVADLIGARSEASHRLSVAQLQGALSGIIRQMRTRLLDLCGYLELELDFSEEGIEFVDRRKLIDEMKTSLAEIQQMIDSYSAGRISREGVRVSLVGRPNVGKSSILNSLLNEDRAIVTPIPGTTRDTIEESVTLGGVLFRISDTAGMREPSDIIEREGIRRSEAEIRESDIVLFVVDATAGIGTDDLTAFGKIHELAVDSSKILLILNKIDLLEKSTASPVAGGGDFPGSTPFAGGPGEGTNLQLASCRVSAKTHEGLDLLRSAMLAKVMANVPALTSDRSVAITNLRQREALARGKARIEAALRDCESNVSPELISVNLRSAIDSLGEIIGTVTSEDLLNNIFSRFCIGK